MLKMKIGERIRELREMQNYTRERFAEKVSISSKFLYEIETGRKGFSAETLCKIAQALSVSCDYIMYGEEKESRNIQKIACVLEMLEPRQISKIYDILKVLYSMCEVL
ncbi:MAG: helix-turn-helix domain-containing protein [Butyrivibrio sp.]|nr:helix-turn-helix domain-containing protein [Butyrivibrio sp.]